MADTSNLQFLFDKAAALAAQYGPSLTETALASVRTEAAK